MTASLARAWRTLTIELSTLYVATFMAGLGCLWLWDHPHNPLFAWAASLGWIGLLNVVGSNVAVWLTRERREAF